VAQFRTIETGDPRFLRDGLFPVTFKSHSLRARADMMLFVPVGIGSARNVPLVILLHGVYGSHWAWALKGGAHTTAAKMIAQGAIPPMVLAMPSDGLWGDGSGYVRHPGGADFDSYIVNEVPACVEEILPTVSRQSPRFIAGLSMGGFGALRLGAKHTMRFHGVSGHSSITHFSQMSRFVEEPLDAYGSLSDADQSILYWIHANLAMLPPIRFDCGTSDPLIEENRTLHRELESRGVRHVYEEFPGGHEWQYWEAHLPDTLRFFTSILRAS
jgi:S-formylglutathione hydrolase FrmB